MIEACPEVHMDDPCLDITLNRYNVILRNCSMPHRKERQRVCAAPKRINPKEKREWQ